jgi:2-hydroxy-6-oxonona-2,4-dienedioate hydrolase
VRVGTRRRAETVCAATALAGAAVGVAIAGACVLDMRRAHARLRGRSTVVPSPCGDIEYTEGGSGPPALVIHGSGGGCDQGELLAKAMLGEGFRWVPPSRFGYLRSTFCEGATFDDQARAYACLLDHLAWRRPPSWLSATAAPPPCSSRRCTLSGSLR